MERVQSPQNSLNFSCNLKRKKAAKASREQCDFLTEYMVKHPLFAAGKFLGKEGKITHEQKWSNLSRILNEIKGAEKDVKQWKTVWRDMKSAVSSKVAKRRRLQNQTGNFSIDTVPLTSSEISVASVLGKEYMEGTEALDSIPEEVPLQRKMESFNDFQCQPSTSHASFSGTIQQDEAIIVAYDDSETDGSTPARQSSSSILPRTETDSMDITEKLTSASATTRQTPNSRNPRIERVSVPEQTAPGSATERQTPNSRRPRRERVAVQMQEARLNFQKLFEQQNATLQGISDGINLLAENSRMLAESSRVQADALKMMAENKKKSLEIVSELTALLKNSENKDVSVAVVTLLSKSL